MTSNVTIPEINEWEPFVKENNKANDERKADEPEPGYKHMGWKWPKEWGNPVDQWLCPTSCLSMWGRPYEVLVFANRLHIRRLTVPVHGYD
jgi:hypothetical protein